MNKKNDEKILVVNPEKIEDAYRAILNVLKDKFEKTAENKCLVTITLIAILSAHLIEIDVLDEKAVDGFLKSFGRDVKILWKEMKSNKRENHKYLH